MAGPDIRAATPDDAAAIAGVHVRTWQVAYQHVMPQKFLDGLDPARRAEGWTRALTQPRPGDSTLVAEDDGQVIGFANVGASRATDAADTDGEVRSIYVDPNRWDTGAGRALMIAGLQALRDAGFEHAVLWVLIENERARRFYEAGGWTSDGAIQHDDSFGVQVSEVRYRRALR